jgi:hypothetical protein
MCSNGRSFTFFFNWPAGLKFKIGEILTQNCGFILTAVAYSGGKWAKNEASLRFLVTHLIEA